ncbi:DNA phosphorothioation-dependent restriction protein DptF [Paenibacillus hexagrammi]|uniref:DNA phosphorothioation-dependent restriction protein DptF n=1 Tax=Paenibacillus hexagrammi TaxID=2908839 RepID=UPI0021A2DC9C|nr:DNA phosphorothioation-dependent restriction protein DptF [Paenibacillus sp. YPD9-1]
MNKTFLQFIESLSPSAYHHASVMEQVIFQDPGLALVKSRNFLEEIIKSIFSFEQLNERESYGKTLFDQVSYLSSEGYLTKELQYAIHSLRKLGNRGAHETVVELEEPLKAHKLMYEIAVWFYELYSSEEDEKLAYNQPKPHDYLDERINQQINKLLGQLNLSGNSDQVIKQEGTIDITEKSPSIVLDLNKGESYLIRELRRLQDSSREAIESANEFSSFKNYLHVDRKVQRDLVSILKKKQESTESNLVLICGSVGDGKSHLLAYLKSSHPELVQNYSIINDATESYSPTMNALETLKQSLSGFSDEQLEGSCQRTLLAINMGVLHNFIQADENNKFYLLKKFIDESGVFSHKRIQHISGQHFDLICIGDYHPYELTANGVQSEFYSGLVNKVFENQPENPFIQAYEVDKKNNIYTATHFNFEFMRELQVQQTVIKLLIECIIKFKLVVSARSFLNFLVDILVVDDNSPYELLDEFYKLDHSIPMLLFNRPERSFILRHMALLNPYTTKRLKEIDQLTINLNMLSDSEEVVKAHVLYPKGRELLSVLMKDTELEHEPFLKFAEAVILTSYITNTDFYYSISISDPMYEQYLWRLYGFNTYNPETVKGSIRKLKTVCLNGRGPQERIIFTYLMNIRNLGLHRSWI